MTYVLQAIVAQQETLNPCSIVGATLVPLSQGICMIPIVESIRGAYGIPYLALTDDNGEPPPGMSEIISKWCLAASKLGKVAYIEANYWGGVGTQAAALWDKGELIREPLVEERAINCALDFLGVVKGSYIDEFAALGLGRFRTTEEW